MATTDAAEFSNHYRADADDLAGKTWKAPDALHSGPMHARRYADSIVTRVFIEVAVRHRIRRSQLRRSAKHVLVLYKEER